MSSSIDINEGKKDEVVRRVLRSLDGVEANIAEVAFGLAEALGRTIQSSGAPTIAKSEITSFAMSHVLNTVKAGMDAAGQGNAGFMLP